MRYSRLKDHEVEPKLKAAVARENECMMDVIYLMLEMEKRRLYGKTKSSLHAYCVEVLGFEGGTAQVRIDVVRALLLMPEMEEKIVSGSLSLSSVGFAQSFFKQEKKAGKPYSVGEKRAVLEKLENDKTEIKTTLKNTTLDKLDKFKALLSHKFPHMTDAELIDVMAEMALEKLDPARKKTRASKRNPAPKVKATPTAASSQHRTSEVRVAKSARRVALHTEPTAATRRALWIRDQGQCTWPGCSSTHFIEEDHIIPIACGGTSELDNMRLLCHTHNQVAAIEKLGKKHMSQFIHMH